MKVLTKSVILLTSLFSAPFSLKAQTKQPAPVQVSCSNSEYIKIGLSDGENRKHILFASVPCAHIPTLHDAFGQEFAKSTAKDFQWEAFRFRSEGKPGESGFTKFDYLGKATPLGWRSLVVILTKDMLQKLADDDLDLENTSRFTRHAVMILRKDIPVADVVEMSKDPKRIEEYVKSHLVLLAYPENVGH